MKNKEFRFRYMALYNFGWLLFFVLVFKNTTAGDIDKAFKYLNTGDYANAQKYLREALNDDRENVAVNFGLARFYFLKDNKLYNVDSANAYIKKAVAKTPLKPDDKQTKKYLTLGVRDYTIQTLQQEINQAAYALAETTNSTESYQYFIDHFTDKGLLSRAVSARNQIAFIHARAASDVASVAEFMKKYPEAEEMKEAKQLYEKLLYEKTTSDKTFQSYKNYLDTYPNGAYAAEAKKNYEEKLLEYYNTKHELNAYLEFDKAYRNHPAYPAIQDSIYQLATKAGTVEAYHNFVSYFKTNPHVREAWDKLYTLATAEATEDAYINFLNRFSDFPDKQRAYIDLELAKKELKKFQQGSKWGYAVQPTKDSIAVVIPFEYEEAFDFNCGLAAVRTQPCNNGCSYFYIDKNDKRAIAGNFSYAGNFEKGYAIAAIGNCEEDSCKYGLIDKNGRWVAEPVYDELEDPTEGLYSASRNNRYGFINQQGEVAVSMKYTDAFAFSEGLAAVALDSSWFFIDTKGTQAFIQTFRDVSSFKDSLCAASTDGETYGYVDHTGNFIILPMYESADDFEAGFAIVSKKEKDPKHKGLFISQRYKIDTKGKIIEKLTAPKEITPKTSRKKKRR
jgi:hypothetical protein